MVLYVGQTMISLKILYLVILDNFSNFAIWPTAPILAPGQKYFFGPININSFGWNHP